MYKFALIGFGGLGKLHFKNLLQIEKERGDITLCAICGADRATLTQTSSINIGSTSLENVDFSEYRLYDTVDELLENEELDFVISALPTILHAKIAITVMEHGIDIFSEKPMALSVSDCEKMVEAAKKHKRLLMIGQCLRFDGAYQKVKEYIDSRLYGKVLRTEFTRYSPLPKWTFNNWILDRNQSGGCPLDMHIHDVDLINQYFGIPESVSSYATHNKVEFESIFTRYAYEDKIVTAAADWSFPQTYPFNARLLMLFEKATVLVNDGTLTVFKDDEKIFPEIDREDYFLKELREFIECTVSGRKSEISTGESVMNSVKIIDAELLSSQQNGRPISI